MTRKLNITLAIMVALVMILSACSSNDAAPEKTTQPSEPEATESSEGSSEESARSGGTIIMASSSEPGNLNPVVWPTTSDTDVTNLMIDCLVVPDENLKMVGSLAKDWTISEDGKTYTFNLVEGVKWHDGEPFTAYDVEFTFTSIANPAYDAGSTSRIMPVAGAQEYRDGAADHITGIEVIDNLTISFTTVEASAAFLPNLYIGIVPKHILGDVSPAEWAKHETNRAPVGTGPFKFVEWKTGEYIKVEANMDYFKGEPQVDEIIYRFGDKDTMLAAFLNQEIDITSVPIAEVESVASVPFANIAVQNNLSVYYIGCNLIADHVNNENVRKAISMGINKDLLAKSILGEYGAREDDIFPSSHWSHSPNISVFDYDVESAKQLLEDAGYTMGDNGFYAKDGDELALTLEVPTGNQEREASAVIIKQDLAKIGINVELQLLDFPTLVTKLLPSNDDGTKRQVTADDFDFYILGFGVEADPDEYKPYFHDAFMPPNGYNFCGYSDPYINELFEKQITQMDQDERQATFWEIGEYISAQQPWIPLYKQSKPYVYNSKVGNFGADMRGVTMDAMYWTVND